MTRFVNKTMARMAAIAILLLATVGLSAQSFEDDVYYSPSKNTTSKTKKDVVKKEVLNTNRQKAQNVDDFTAAQKRYAQILSSKQATVIPEDENVYEDENSWVYNTQGLAQKQEINREVSLYNRGGIGDEESYTEEQYVLWQPTTVTRVYTMPRSPRWYFGMSFGWGPFHLGWNAPYYAYDPFWDYDYYDYWRYRSYRYYGHYNGWWRGPFCSSWRHYYPSSWYWRGYYDNPYAYYNHYSNHGYYGYNDYYYRPHRTYRRSVQRPRESRIINNSNRISSRGRHSANAANKSRANYAPNRNSSRYSSSSSNKYRRKSTSSSATRGELPRSNYRQETVDRNLNRSTPSTTRSRRSSIHQGKAPYTRRVNSSSNYRRGSANTPSKQSNINRSTYRRSTTPTHRRSSSNNNYRKVGTSAPRRSSYKQSSTYRKPASTPTRSNYRSTGSSSRRSRVSTPVKRSSYKSSTPSRRSSSSSNTSYRRSSRSSSSSSSSSRSRRAPEVNSRSRR